MYSYNDNLIMILVGNKTDLSNKREVTEEEGKSLIKNDNMEFFESSALSGYNINEIFKNATLKIYNIIKDGIENKEYKGISEERIKNKLDIDENIYLGINLDNQNQNQNSKRKKKKCSC